MTLSGRRDVITPRDVITLLLLVNSVSSHIPKVTSSGVVRVEEEQDTHYIHRYTNIEYLNANENEQVINLIMGQLVWIEKRSKVVHKPCCTLLINTPLLYSSSILILYSWK